MLVSRLNLRTAAAGATLALLLAAPDIARAQGKFEASYGISVARIPIGGASAAAEFSDAHYLVTMSGRASGMMRVFTSGDGSLRTRGTLTAGRPAPTEFTARTTTDDDTLDVKLVIDGGNVTEFSASEPTPHPDRVELTDAHRRGIVDPLTALLVPLAGDGALNRPPASARWRCSTAAAASISSSRSSAWIRSRPSAAMPGRRWSAQ